MAETRTITSKTHWLCPSDIWKPLDVAAQTSQNLSLRVSVACIENFTSIGKKIKWVLPQFRTFGIVSCVHSFLHSFYSAIERSIAKKLCAFYVHRQIVSIPKKSVLSQSEFVFNSSFCSQHKTVQIRVNWKEIEENKMLLCAEFLIEFDNLINMARTMASYPNHSISINFINTKSNSFVYTYSVHLW